MAKAKAAPLMRPRSRRAHDKALDAAIQLFAERGIEGASMDAIAESSGVSKATLYKHWADKDALCLEVMVRVHGLDCKRPDFNSGDLCKDLADMLAYRPPEASSELRQRLTPHLMAYAARNPEFGAAWRSRVIAPGREQLVRILQRGVERKQIPAGLNMRVAAALLAGPMLYAHIFGRPGLFPEDLAEQVAEAFWRAFALPGPEGPRPARLQRKATPSARG